ncbi:PHP, C-terminal [Syntrophomonas zehnderi OL-4]|uniref:PHP, C-terminal n=1 Tax=Syntrophomonas zehnderi OL-4 TaxID=690567 RepID=A0A0E3WAR0_9FIRM|nr:PHP domain-containing protein [Syntrophomonas zehnderi]CQB51980.1 PHP, C-terminal [Syntrophomonas zehnderi OL-4]
MNFFGDYHTHSRYSDGLQSVEDIVRAAQRRGLKEVAVTDHGPDMLLIGIKNADRYLKLKEELKVLNDSGQYGVKVLLGAEANILDLKGTLDIPDNIARQMDILIAGLHPYTRPASLDDGLKIWVQNSLRHMGKRQKEKAKNANTKASCEALYNNPEINILSHPGLVFAVDIKEVAHACVKNDVWFEINCAHKYPLISDIIEAEQTGVDFIVNSDAHYPASVGQLSYGEYIIKRLHLDPQRVANSWDEGEC